MLLLLAPALAADVVLRDLPAPEGAVRVEAAVDVAAPRAAVWAALVDFGARKVKAIEWYRPSTATEMWIRWTVSALGFEVTYHNHYQLAPDRSWLLHELDTSMPNDLSGSRGRFTLADVAGGTRLVYDVETHFGRAIPGVVRRWLSSSAVEDFMADIVRRAEGA
ncbi:MAG: SRPBCC family protein [Myxococcota bacterium]